MNDCLWGYCTKLEFTLVGFWKIVFVCVGRIRSIYLALWLFFNTLFVHRVIYLGDSCFTNIFFCCTFIHNFFLGLIDNLTFFCNFSLFSDLTYRCFFFSKPDILDLFYSFFKNLFLFIENWSLIVCFQFCHILKISCFYIWIFNLVDWNL